MSSSLVHSPLLSFKLCPVDPLRRVWASFPHSHSIIDTCSRRVRETITVSMPHSGKRSALDADFICRATDGSDDYDVLPATRKKRATSQAPKVANSVGAAADETTVRDDAVAVTTERKTG
jgi:hypothetical protein